MTTSEPSFYNEALQRASQAFLQQTDCKATLALACRLAVERFGMQTAWAGLIEQDGGFISPMAAYGQAENNLASHQIDLRKKCDNPIQEAVLNDKTVVINQLQKQVNFSEWLLPHYSPDIHSMAVLPLYDDQQQVSGVLTLYSQKPDDFTQTQLMQLQSYTNLAAISLQRAVFHEQSLKEKNLVEEELRLLSTAANAAANGIVITDTKGNIIWANPAFERLTRYKVREASGKNPRFLKSGLHDKDFYNTMWRTITAGRVWHGEVVNKRKDETYYTEEMTIAPVHSTEGQLTHFIAIKQDVTARKQAEQALRESEEKFRALAENIEDFFWLRTPDKMIYASPAFEKIWQQSCQNIYENPDLFFESMLPEDRQAVFEELEAISVPESQLFDKECRIRRPDGSIRWIHARSFPIADEEGKEKNRSAGIATDITEQKAFEAQLINSQKMIGLGTMAAGLAHEINSPLQVITGLSERLLNQMQNLADYSPPDYVIKDLHSLKRNSWRVASIVSALLTYVQGSTQAYQAHDLNELVHDSLLLSERRLSQEYGITIIKDLAENLPPLYCDRNKITEAILHLLSNAQDATPVNGSITIHTGLRTERDQQYLLLQISDTGKGIPEQHHNRIFDPFFTTKPIGQGVGLGLSIVMGIVRAHHGLIDVSSKTDNGTVITLLFPPYPNAETAVAPKRQNQQPRFDDSVIPPYSKNPDRLS